MTRTIVASAAALVAIGFVASTMNVVVSRELAPTVAVPVVALDLPDNFVSATEPVAVAIYDLPPDYAVPMPSTYDAAALDVPAPITIEG